ASSAMRFMRFSCWEGWTPPVLIGDENRTQSCSSSSVADAILLTKGEPQICLRAKYANRHGMVSGATGTGKTVSLMVIVEGLSRIGVPVFIADVKGDVSGLATPGAGDASPVIF